LSRERLQKVMAAAGVASRRASEELIRQGRVTVNGRVAEVGSKADPAVDAIKVDGKLLGAAPAKSYLLLNKPTGYLTTRSDPEGRPTVFELIAPRHRKNLVPVGRLDYLTEGLILLTNDGDLAQKVAHPSHGCTKTYLVKVKGHPKREAIHKLSAGVVLDGRRTSPAKIQAAEVRGRRAVKENSWWTVEISEGRTRQIREMFYRVGHPVQRLKRVAIGAVQDPRLPVGSYRELTEKEIEGLRRGAP
jgi:23S rRNA pseudouridine2605 synthase